MKNKQKIISSVILLFLFLLSASYSNLNEPQYKTQEFNEKSIKKSAPIFHDKFIVGTGSGVNDLDPAMAWDYASLNVIDQVCEGLFWNNFSTPDSDIIPVLAASEGTWSIDGLNYTIPLRTGVYFHDGTKFNGTAVKFTFDRLLYFTNATGMLNESSASIAQFHSLYEFSDGTPIINRVEVIDEYTVRFILNDKYGALLGLLSFEGSFIVSPASTPALDYIHTASGDLVGTGPFVYDGYIADVEVNFHAFENYWNGMANITKMQFKVIQDYVELNNALINGDIHFLDGLLTSMLPTFEADPDIHVIDEGKTESVLYYLCMNNENINKTWRQAISNAINYTYIIEELIDGLGVRSKSPIPEGTLYSNATLDYATLNLTKARLLVQSMGFGTGLVANDETEGSNADAWRALDIVSWNYSYNTDNQFRADLGVLLNDNLDLIGIDVIDQGMSWSDFIYRAYGYMEPGGYDSLDLFWIGWGMDFNDPSTMLKLMHSTYEHNSAQVDDSYLDTLIDQGIAENDPDLREAIYNDIQQYVVEDLMPWAFGYSPKMYAAHHVDLTGFQQNTFGNLYFYPCELALFTNPDYALIYIDDNDPLYDWSKTALENDWCTGSGTLNDPYVIKDIEIDGESVYNGIIIHNSHAYFKIENCTLHDLRETGIHLVNTNNSLIYNNSFYDSRASYAMIYLEYSNNNSVSLNKIWNISVDMFDYGAGIFLSGSNDCNINHNTINEAGYGILSGQNSGTMIDYNNISNTSGAIATASSLNSTIKDNYVYNNSYGIVLQMANDTMVRQNTVIENDISIYLMGHMIGCSDNTIIQNQIYDSRLYGVILNEWTSHNEIFLNEFIGNAVNAQDNGTLNEWDNGVIGNSWDDYPGNDLDDDGIGDDPYLINGTSGSFDNYPIWDDGENNAPFITVILPAINDNFGLNAPAFNITIYDEFSINTTWYTIDGGTNNITILALTGTLDESAWDLLPDGDVTITFYANDTEGNIGSAQVMVYKDTTLPVIIINDPNNGDFLDAPPEYDIDITEDNLDSMWYTLDDGANNITILSLVGSLDGSAWNALPDGAVIITFYANDTAGNIGVSTQLTVYKDTIAPVIVINLPSSADEFTTNVPIYDITITEENIDTIWYTMDGGVHNLEITTYTGSVDSTSWNALPNGQVTITFYVNDTVGQMDSDFIIVYKNTPAPPPSIPGPNTILITLILLLGTIGLVWRSKNKLKLK